MTTAQTEIPAKERILETAQRLFYRNGVHATGVDKLIAEAGVTKVTFYRHFPSKDRLIEAFLERRHKTWIEWFKKTIEDARKAQSARERLNSPLTPVLHAAKDLMHSSTFRGCAFANTVAEVGMTLQTVLELATQHKKELSEIIESLLPISPGSPKLAWAATLALDGAIVNALTGGLSGDVALGGLETLLSALDKATKSEN